MAVPWLRILDVVLGVTDLARSRQIRAASRPPAAGDGDRIALSGRTLGGLEGRLAAVVVSALREAFDRDTRRLELERQQLEMERRRAERALRLELLRQAGDREIGRLRLLAGVAVASWLGSLFLAARLAGAGVGPRVSLGCGWILLLTAIAASFAGQSRIARALEPSADDTDGSSEPVSPGMAGALAVWSMIGGLALAGISVLMLR